MKTCLYCDTDLCTCTGRIATRYAHLVWLVPELRRYFDRCGAGMSQAQKDLWHQVYNISKQDLRKLELLLIFNPPIKNAKRKSKRA